VTAALPPGWSYESGDPTVGIFGDLIWHQDCPGVPAAEADDPREATQTEVARLNADRTVRYWDLHLACPYEDCGATATVPGWWSESAPWPGMADHAPRPKRPDPPRSGDPLVTAIGLPYARHGVDGAGTYAVCPRCGARCHGPAPSPKGASKAYAEHYARDHANPAVPLPPERPGFPNTR
jgi:hypothetical protein